MLTNYLLVAWRNLITQKLFTLVNVSGLALSIMVILLTILFIRYEKSFETFHKNKARIHRVTSSEMVNGDFRHRSGTAYSASSVLHDEIPSIEKAVKVFHHQDYLGLPLLKSGDKKILVNRLSYADPDFFDIFSFGFVAGNQTGCLDDPQSIVLSRKIAESLFGDVHVIGQNITISVDRDGDPLDLTEDYTMKITAVIENLPSNTHFDFDVLIPSKFSPNERWSRDNWYYQAFPTYVLLKDGSSVERVNEQLEGFVDKFADPKIKDRLVLQLQPLSDIRLNNLPGDDKSANSQMESIKMITAISIVILILACINFINLTTAQYARRAREVGLRKTIGAQRADLIRQFLIESILISFVSVVAGIICTILAIPFFNVLLDSNIHIYQIDSILLAVMIALVLIIGIISGSYPAFYLSNFRPTAIVRGTIQQKNNQLTFRRFLVVIQFSLTSILLIAIVVINLQMTHMLDARMNIDIDQYVFIRSKEDVYSNYQKYETFKTELTSNSTVKSASGTWSIPFGVNAPVFFYPFLAEGMNRDERLHMHLFRADHDFIDTFGFELLEGRDFSKSFPNDPTSSFILNEAAVKALNWNGNSIGKELEVYSGGGTAFKKGKVIGVVKNVNFQSLHKAVAPMVISMTNNQRYRYIALKVNSTNKRDTFDHIESTWNEFVPGWPIEMFHLENEWVLNYNTEQKLANIIQTLTIIGILIASLGLYGLASYTTIRRQKEIGIRKVIGANVIQIINLLNREFLILISVSIITAIPLGRYLANIWLDQFAYKIILSPGIFISVALLVLFLGAISVSYHCITAAYQNPVNVLKNE